MSEQLNPGFAVRERNFWGWDGTPHRLKALELLLHPDECGFAADFYQLAEMKRS